MNITLTEAEAHYHILRSLGLAGDATLASHASGVFVLTKNPHTISIISATNVKVVPPAIGTIDGPG